MWVGGAGLARTGQRPTSMVVGDQGTLLICTDCPVVPDRGVEREEPLDDPGEQAVDLVRTGMLDPELALQGLVHRLNPLAKPLGKDAGLRFVRAGRPDQRQMTRCHVSLQLPAPQALVTDDGR